MEKSKLEVELADYKNKYWKQSTLMEESIYIIQEIIKVTQGKNNVLNHALETLSD